MLHIVKPAKIICYLYKVNASIEISASKILLILTTKAYVSPAYIHARAAKQTVFAHNVLRV